MNKIIKSILIMSVIILLIIALFIIYKVTEVPKEKQDKYASFCSIQNLTYIGCANSGNCFCRSNSTIIKQYRIFDREGVIRLIEDNRRLNF